MRYKGKREKADFLKWALENTDIIKQVVGPKGG